MNAIEKIKKELENQKKHYRSRFVFGVKKGKAICQK